MKNKILNEPLCGSTINRVTELDYDRNRIIEDIRKRCIAEKMANKFQDRFSNTMDKDDYVQEMYMILLEMSDKKLEALYEKKEIFDYFSRICLNQMVNRKSNFHRKYETYLEKKTIMENGIINNNEYETDDSKQFDTGDFE